MSEERPEKSEFEVTIPPAPPEKNLPGDEGIRLKVEAEEGVEAIDDGDDDDSDFDLSAEDEGVEVDVDEDDDVSAPRKGNLDVAVLRRGIASLAEKVDDLSSDGKSQDRYLKELDDRLEKLERRQPMTAKQVFAVAMGVLAVSSIAALALIVIAEAIDLLAKSPASILLLIGLGWGLKAVYDALPPLNTWFGSWLGRKEK